MLESLKQENVKDFDKEREVERVLGMITGEQFFQLFSLWKKITDRAGDGDEDVGVDPDMERKDTMRLGLPLSLRKKKMQRATKSVKIALATKMMATMTMHTERTPTLL